MTAFTKISLQKRHIFQTVLANVRIYVCLNPPQKAAVWTKLAFKWSTRMNCSLPLCFSSFALLWCLKAWQPHWHQLFELLCLRAKPRHEI